MDTHKRICELENEITQLEIDISKKENNDPTNSWDEFQYYMRLEWNKRDELSRELRMLMIPKFKKLPDYGDIM